MIFLEGSESRVNTFKDGDQRDQKMALLSDGSWVVVWSSSEQDVSTPGGQTSTGIYMKHFDANGGALGAEVHVNTHVDSSQYQPHVAALAAGGFVVTWTSFGQDDTDLAHTTGIFGQVFGPTAAAFGSELQINETTKYGQQLEHIAALTGGGFVVDWQSVVNLSATVRQLERRFDAGGNEVLTETGLGSSVSGDETIGRIAALKDGGWVVAYTGAANLGNVYVDMYNSNSVPQLSSSLVSTTTSFAQGAPEVVGLKSGGFLVVWESFNQDGNDYGVYQRIYNADGSQLGDVSEILVNTTTNKAQEAPLVVALDDGGWVVLWQQRLAADDVKLIFQQYTATGERVGGETTAATATSAGFSPRIVALEGGGWVIVYNGKDSDQNGVFQTAYKDGDLHTSRVNATTAGQQYGPEVVALQDGGWAVSWHSIDQGDDEGNGVYQRVFHIAKPPTDITGKLKWTEGKDGKVGTLHAVDGDDTDGFTWALLDNAGGRFAIDAHTGKVTVNNAIKLDYEQSKIHTITVQVTDDDGNVFTKALTAKGTDVAMEDLVLSAKADKVWGGDKVDTFDGGKGNDTIKGGGGKDVLDGGKGKDTADYSDKTKSVVVTLDGSETVTVKVDGKAEDSITNFENVIGGSKADELTGDNASNVLAGGLGKDILKGGGGKDFFVFDTALGAKNVDTIADFKPKDDIIRIEAQLLHNQTSLETPPNNAFLANKTGQAEDASDRFIYDTKTGKLYFDEDGVGGVDHILIALLIGKPALTAANIEIV